VGGTLDTTGRRPAVPVGEECQAPGELAVIEAFVNTTDLENPADGEQFRSPKALTAWLRRYGLLLDHESVTTGDEVARTIDLREALRDVLEANYDGLPLPVDAFALLDDEAQRVDVTMRFTPTGTSLEATGRALDGAIGALLTIVLDAMRDGSWRRLKVCRNATCRWAHWDASRNRSSKWCDMAVCGNRVKARNFRERHAEDAHLT
jgi:predicted RNA-binding Zn ribbon-like protein